MAGLKGLVDTSASCGAVNPLMKLTSHVSKDQGKSDFTKYTKKGNFKNEYINLLCVEKYSGKYFQPYFNLNICI